MKIGRNGPCFCGSGKKLKKCCELDRPPRGGVLRMAYETSPEDPFAARMLFQILNIREHIYKEAERLKFDDLHTVVFQNLDEAKIVKSRCIELIKQHRNETTRGINCSHIPSTDQINIDKPIDTDLNIFFKDFFIRGNMALKGLVPLGNFMGLDIGFAFKKEGEFLKGKDLFTKTNSNPGIHEFVSMIEQHREGWFELFIKLRNDIEHKGFKYPIIKYVLDPQNIIKPKYPLFNGQTTEEILETFWINLMGFCEDVIVFLLSLKIEDPFVVIEVPEDKRDKDMPAKYKAVPNKKMMDALKRTMESNSEG